MGPHPDSLGLAVNNYRLRCLLPVASSAPSRASLPHLVWRAAMDERPFGFAHISGPAASGAAAVPCAPCAARRGA